MLCNAIGANPACAPPGRADLTGWTDRPQTACNMQNIAQRRLYEWAPGMVADRRPVVGILGGMGPAATADFFAKLIQATPAEVDQDHLRVLLWSDPTVPDRTAALLERGPDPTAWLVHGAKLLVAGGAHLIAVPCNTAHAFLGPVEQQVGVEIVHMIDQTARHVATLDPRVRTVGLLATTGTVRAGLYQGWLARRAIQVVVPTPEEQEKSVMAAVRAVKAGDHGPAHTAALAKAGAHLVTRGAQALIAGCTEIPLVFDQRHAHVPIVDPTAVLARAVVAVAARHASRRGADRPSA
jgi:aspartate racemase